MRERRRRALVALLVLLGSACQPLSAPTSLPSPRPTAIPAPTQTAIPALTPTPSPTPTASPTPHPVPTRTPTPPPRPPLAYGVSVHLYGQDRGRVLDIARDAGFGWVRQQVWWRHIEPWKGSYSWGELDAIVADAHARGLKVLLSIVRSPDWATGGGYGLPRNPSDMGDFLFAMATRYRGQVEAYEVWNEPNLAVENAGWVADPGRYVELLHVAYQHLKEADPAAKVISAALTPTGVTRPWLSTDDVDYLREMLGYSDGMFLSSCDAVGVHAAGTHNPPDTLWPDRPGPGPGWLDHPTHYFRHVENIHGVLAEFGAADKPIWITEFGWATANYSWGYEYGYDNSEEEQAIYIVRALEIVREDWPWVEGAFLWNLNFAVVRGNYHEQGAFGILYSDWSPRPAYRAVQAYLQDVRTRAFRQDQP